MINKLTDEEISEMLDDHIGELGLEVRTVNALEKSSIFTLGDLLNCTPARLLEIPNFGSKTMETIYSKLESKGFYRTNRKPS